MARGVMGLITRKAPDFPSDVQWVNVGAPITLRRLRGTVVVLYFSPRRRGLNGMAPAITAMRKKYRKHPVVTITICSTGALASSALNPAVVDANGRLRKLYGINDWAGVVIIGATGRVDYKVSGDITTEQLNGLVGDSLSKASEAGSLRY